jgi:glycerophosphoryl diester phosphodiesterase
MFNRQAFIRPIAHRGLHDAGRGLIENTGPAFAAAIAKGYGIECDLRPANDGTPVVFHDLTLKGLIDAPGRVSDHSPADLARMTYRQSVAPVVMLSDLLAQVDGRVPLLVEVKSEWGPPDPRFIATIGRQATAYAGPIALMSFDPAVMTALKDAAPGIPRGIVSGIYQGDGWWRDKIDEDRSYRLSHLLDSGPVSPDFFAYHVDDLPTPVTRFIREGLGMPLFTWTVRTPEQRAAAARWADAPIFEGFEA